MHIGSISGSGSWIRTNGGFLNALTVRPLLPLGYSGINLLCNKFQELTYRCAITLTRRIVSAKETLLTFQSRVNHTPLLRAL